MNALFSLYTQPREIIRLAAGTALEYLVKGWGIAGAVNVLIGSGATASQKVVEAASGIPGIITNVRRIWYALEHQEEIHRALQYMHGHMPSLEEVKQLGERSQITYNKLSQVTYNIEQGLDQLSQTSLLSPRSSLDHAAQAQAHFKNAYELAPSLPDVKNVAEAIKTGNEALARTYEFLQQVDYQRIYTTLNNIADNLQAGEVRMTVTIAATAIAVTYAAGTVIGARTTRGMPGITTRFRQDWAAGRFPNWYRKNIRRILGDNLYQAARMHVEDDLRRKGKLKEGP